MVRPQYNKVAFYRTRNAVDFFGYQHFGTQKVALEISPSMGREMNSGILIGIGGGYQWVQYLPDDYRTY
jgi:hypothetical protein